MDKKRLAMCAHNDDAPEIDQLNIPEGWRAFIIPDGDLHPFAVHSQTTAEVERSYVGPEDIICIFLAMYCHELDRMNELCKQLGEEYGHSPETQH